MAERNTMAKSAAMIAFFTLFSKFLGFIREIMIASRFGSGMETDTYFVAMTATVIIMGTVGAALNTTLVPIFSEIGATRGRKGKLNFLNNIFNMVFFLTIILAILAYFLSPIIVKILAKGFQGEQLELAIKLNRIGLPIIIFLGFTYVFSGFLHSNQIFGPHSIMGIPYNLVFLIYLIFFSKDTNIGILMGVSVLASATQFLIQLPATRHLGFRYSLDVNLRDPYLKRALVLIFPIILGSAVQQINIIIDKTLASDLIEGSISALTYASRINDMIISVFVAAITTVIFPMLSQAFSQGNNKKVVDIFNQGVNIVLIITIPATIGILILSKPLVYLFFERNAFHATATLMTSQALLFYSVGLIGSALRLMLNKVYYSFQDTTTPMVNGVLAVVLNIIFNLILIKPMGHNGLALATSISATISTIILFISLRKKLGPIGITKVIITLLKSLISAIIMGVVVYFLYYKVGGLLPDIKIIQMISLIISVLIGIIIYLFMTIILGVQEIKLIIRSFVRRL